MTTVKFAKRVIIVTLAIAFLMYFFFPRYQFIDEKHRVNIVNGKSEYYSKEPYNMGWHE